MSNVIQHQDFESALRGAANEVAKQQAMQDVGNTIKGSAGLGLMAGGGYALWRLLRRPNPGIGRRVRPSEAVLPVKMAGDSVLAGDNALDASGVWWKAPLALAGGMTAAAGTAGLIKHVSNRIASGNRKAKEEEARAAFENALAKSLKPVMTKAASDEDLGDKLVTLFSLMTKSAAFDDAMASALKMYGLYAVGTGLGAGALAYSSSRNKKLKALKQAVSARQAGQLRSQPTEITLPGISSAPLANTVE